MNTAEKIESVNYPPFRRHKDRVRAISLAVQQVEREHAVRSRRMGLLLGSAAALLLLNGLLISLLG